MNRQFVLLLFLVATASSLLVVQLAYSSVTTPSVPEFTMKFVYSSYAVTTTNPYTGLDETERISNNSIEITIKNQPFNYPEYQFYYEVHVKPHFADDDWTYACKSKPQSNSSYTIISFPVVPTDNYGETGYDIQSPSSEYGDVLDAIPDGSQLDFHVKAFIGHYESKWVTTWLGVGGEYVTSLVIAAQSDWSQTQTVAIDNQPKPQQTDQFTTLFSEALIIVVVAASSGLAFYLIKRKRSS